MECWSEHQLGDYLENDWEYLMVRMLVIQKEHLSEKMLDYLLEIVLVSSSVC